MKNEWGILPITDTIETRTGDLFVILNIDTLFYRALEAAARVLESFRWVEA